MTKENELNTTIDEWRAEMERIDFGAPGKTLRELCSELGMKRTTMQNRLADLIQDKRCIKGVGKRIGVGGVYPVSVYQLIPQEKESKK